MYCQTKNWAAVFCLGLLLHFFCLTADAQEQIGLKIDNYSGINGITLNPASSVLTPLNWDINLGTVAFHLENTYVYVAQTSLLNLLQNAENIEMAPAITGEQITSANPIIVDFFDEEKNKTVFVNANVQGPSFRFRLKKHSFGLHTAFRTMVGSGNIPSILGYYNFERQTFNNPFEVSPFQISGMSWSEIGLHFSTSLSETDNGQLSFGANLKYLQAYEAFYLKNHENIDLTKINDNNLDLGTGHVSYGFASQFTEESGEFNNTGLQKNGTGWAADLGLQYIITKDEEHLYQWKFGVSLLDLGLVNLSQNAQKHDLSTDSLVSTYLLSFEQGNDLQDFTEILSNEILGNTATSLQANQFNLWLPAALSLQAELAFNRNIYLHALLVRRLPNAAPHLVRPNTFALTPRLESKWLSLALPMVWNDQRNFRMGAALKFGFLTIGSDNLQSIFQEQATFTGTDVYVSLKVMPFSFKKKTKKRNKKNKYRYDGKKRKYNYEDCPKVG